MRFTGLMRLHRRPEHSPPPAADVPVGEKRRLQVERAIPVGVEIAGQWAWRLLVILGLVTVIALLVIEVRDIVVPVLVALLVSALLIPFKSFLVRHRWPRWLAILVALVAAVAIIGGLITIVVFQVRSGLSELVDRSEQQLDALLSWLAAPPFNLDQEQLESAVGDALTSISADTSTLIDSALTLGSTAGHVLEGLFIVFFTTLFLLIDGRGIWTWIARLFPRRARRAVDGAGVTGWLTLTTFVKVQIFVAFIDAVGIGLGAWIIGFFIDGFPLVIPIAVLVFLASFVPVVGAILSGAVAVFVALVYGGLPPAVVMLGIVLLVQQIEGHVLQPLVMGTAVRVHPLAVVLAVTTFSAAAGIPGALFAVPFVATLNVMVKYIASGTWRTDAHPDLDDVAATSDVVERE
ncbi:MAG: AI-2E family transporter [Microbacteriaceae bacterium]